MLNVWIKTILHKFAVETAENKKVWEDTVKVEDESKESFTFSLDSWNCTTVGQFEALSSTADWWYFATLSLFL